MIVEGVLKRRGEQAEAGTERSIGKRMPGCAEARLEVAIGGRHETIADAGVPREDEPERCAGIARALLARPP